MARGLSYADAVRVLGGQDNRTTAVLDKLMGGLLTAASAAGAGFVVSLFNPRTELVNISTHLLAGLGQRLRGETRLRRSERLAAAHVVIVLTAYFESLREIDLPFDVNDLELTMAEQVSMTVPDTGEARSVRMVADAVLWADVPMPVPHRPYERTLEVLTEFDRRISERLVEFVSGLAVWDRLTETDRQRVRDSLLRTAPQRAVARYEELFQRLATDFPEVALWANLVDHQATRADINQLRIGLAGMEKVLAGIAVGRVPDDRRAALTRGYRAALDRPILSSGQIPDGLRLPPLGEIYVNPDFRVAQVGARDRLADESWWGQCPVRDDLPGFLAGYLTAPQATDAPLMVLGHPGSGKSVLTEVLAARLPASEFLVVRVELRDVPADIDLQAQLEYAVRATTGESVAWPDLVRSADGALPVVLLDGFDELLQATGVSQSDYLEKVARFQDREAAQGRPVVVVVTSRTAVADRARPAEGMVSVRLEPFRVPQIERWLAVWNAANAPRLAARSLRALTADTVLAHTELASQPLLLLMLALYDADGNALHREKTMLGEADVYERLLTSFAEREVRKSSPALPSDLLGHAVEQELLRLSIAACAMFNRARQWVTERELDADLTALLDPVREQPAVAGLRAELTAAEIVIGRFFFVHEARATRDATRLSSYEFLHATFGEYLIARLVAHELGELADTAEHNVARRRPTVVDDAFIHAVLSFMPLTMRGTVVSFFAERAQMLTDRQRELLRDVLLGLFHDVLQPRRTTTLEGYQPMLATVPARHATYAANLLLLVVLVASEVTSDELFPGDDEPIDAWRRLALLWRSQLPPEGWTGLIQTLVLRREWNDDRRVVRLHASNDDEPLIPRSDPSWTYGHSPDSNYIGWTSFDHNQLRAQSHFLCAVEDDTFAHSLEPLAGDLGNMITTFFKYQEGHAVSPAHAVIALWIATNQQTEPATLAEAYEVCLKYVIHGFGPDDVETRKRFRALVLHQLATDHQRLPSDWLHEAIMRIKKAGKSSKYEGPELMRMAYEALPSLMEETAEK